MGTKHGQLEGARAGRSTSERTGGAVKGGSLCCILGLGLILAVPISTHPAASSSPWLGLVSCLLYQECFLPALVTLLDLQGIKEPLCWVVLFQCGISCILAPFIWPCMPLGTD